MKNDPAHLFNAALDYSAETKKTVETAVALPLHEIVLAAWSISERLSEIRDELEKGNRNKG